MSKIRGKPWGNRKWELRKQIFERTYYFCKLHEINIYEYVVILIDECNQSEIYELGTIKEYLEFIKTKKENEQ